MREISLNILDITRNSLKAGAKHIEIGIVSDEKFLSVTVKDDGCGMSAEMLESAADPFTTQRKTRAVGLGIPLFKHSAELTGGSFKITSSIGKGTTVTAIYCTDSVNLMPMGDLGETILQLITAETGTEFTVSVKTTKGSGEIATKKLKKVIGAAEFTHPDIIGFLRKYLKENITDLMEV